jgi:glycerol-3-phosphate dehydrogenase
VTGGKLTTYRRMAEEVVDRACRHLGRGGRCRTPTTPLGLTRPLGAETARAAAAARALQLPPEVGSRLVARFGDDWEDAVALLREDPSLGEEVVPDLPVRNVELLLARTREMAITDEDVLERRTRLTTMDRDATAGVTGSVGS